MLMRDGISGNGLCSKDLETLFVWENISDIHGPQELKVSPHPKRVEFETKRWLELIKDYELIIEYRPRKTNVVAML